MELKGRLYWFAKPGAPLNDPNLWQPTALVSANFDGSGQQSPPLARTGRLSFDQWHGNNDWGPHVYGDALYCLMYPDTNSDPPYQKRITLCRIHIGQGTMFEAVYQLPPGSTFGTLDEGYIYFNLPETQYSSLWTSLTGDTRDSKDVTILCRANLPVH